MISDKAMLLLVIPLLVTSCGIHSSNPTTDATVKTIDSLCTQDTVIRTHGKDADVMDNAGITLSDTALTTDANGQATASLRGGD